MSCDVDAPLIFFIDECSIDNDLGKIWKSINKIILSFYMMLFSSLLYIVQDIWRMDWSNDEFTLILYLIKLIEIKHMLALANIKHYEYSLGFIVN